MRDSYDIYILLKLQGHNIDKMLLSKAVMATSEMRESLTVLSNGQAVLEEVFSSETLCDYWVRYQKKYSYADDISWEEVKDSIFTLWDMVVVDI